MSSIQTYLPPPPGVEMITAWDDGNGEWYAECMPLLWIKATNSGGYGCCDDFDVMDVGGDALRVSATESCLQRGFRLADGRVVVPQIGAYESVDCWLAIVKEDDYFVPVAKESPVSENTVTMALILVAPVSQDGNKWRFSDGSGAASFSAAIEDEAFITRVNNGERFGKGDVLTVEMRIVQTRTANRISIERVVKRVVEHRESAQQQPLL